MMCCLRLHQTLPQTAYLDAMQLCVRRLTEYTNSDLQKLDPKQHVFEKLDYLKTMSVAASARTIDYKKSTPSFNDKARSPVVPLTKDLATP